MTYDEKRAAFGWGMFGFATLAVVLLLICSIGWAIHDSGHRSGYICAVEQLNKAKPGEELARKNCK